MKANPRDFLGDGFHLSKMEEKVLAYWKTNRVFEKSLEKRRGRKRFVFYEGPPTANGKPGIHHVLARAFKDVIPRYKTMAGYLVPRKGGWDTHGLPVEIEVEKELGLKTKKDIERYGVAAFNKKCKESVWRYKDEWERLTERMGFWLDLKDPYITYENSYIESLWWIIKRAFDKNLMYKGHKVVPWCSRCGTALSSHEMAQGYKEVTDRSVYLKFRLKPGQKFGPYATHDTAYILSWTTTPWTLPGNVALAVGERMSYTALRVKGVKELYIVASATVPKIFAKQEIEIVHQDIAGKDLVGLAYEPLFKIPSLRNKNSHKIYAADFVNTEEGTGVVHTAVMYGEDDYQLGSKIGLPKRHTVDENGTFTRDMRGLAGLPVKAKETEDKIFAYLKKSGTLLKIEPYTHEYPHCWRCDTPLLYYARTSWFVAMSKLRRQLLANNQKINWIPEHLKKGRFGEWLREVKDWNFSRERYWGTPLPIWECEKCKDTEAIGDMRELESRLPKSRNRYILVRHGQSVSNIARKVSGWPEKEKHHLTLFGRVETERLARQLKDEKVDFIFSSDITRTRETTKILADVFRGEKVFYDKRLREINTGVFNGCHDASYHNYYSSDLEKFAKRPPQGESLTDLRARLWAFLEDVEKKYRAKTIVIVSHEYPIWMLEMAMTGWDERTAVGEKQRRGPDFIKTGEARLVPLRAVPRDETGQMNLHRPYIDEATFACRKCGTKMRRVRELADVWFDSGAMPYAQWHYPFEKGQKIEMRDERLGIPYPADYISEAVDQTRGWFYTLLAVSTLLGNGAPYKNVISLGHINDKFGQKMSKSKGNVVDPWRMAEKHGMDAVRWYFFTATPPGEPKNFDEDEIVKTFRRFHLLLYNSFVFWKTYAKQASSFKLQASRNVLDQWILARLNQTIAEATERLDRYEIREAALAIERLVDDLSRWYIRRSRRRFSAVAKGSGGQAARKDYEAASRTLGFVLAEIAKLIAPFVPFFGEALFTNLGGAASVHFADWPKASKRPFDKKLLDAMEEVRRIASAALAKRAEAGVKVRQPLATLKIKSKNPLLKKNRDLLAVLSDEVNVKQIVVDPKLRTEVELDTTITPELREEGLLRELIRLVQDLRQKAALKPRDKIILMAELPKELAAAAAKHEKTLKTEVNATRVTYRKSAKFDAEIATKIDEGELWLGVKKI